jgi:hypothetical protein
MWVTDITSFPPKKKKCSPLNLTYLTPQRDKGISPSFPPLAPMLPPSQNGCSTVPLRIAWCGASILVPFYLQFLLVVLHTLSPPLAARAHMPPHDCGPEHISTTLRHEKPPANIGGKASL